MSYVCMYAYMCIVYMYEYVCVIYMFLCVFRVCITYVCIYVTMYVCIYVSCIGIYVFICVYVSTPVCKHALEGCVQVPTSCCYLTPHFYSCSLPVRQPVETCLFTAGLLRTNQVTNDAGTIWSTGCVFLVYITTNSRHKSVCWTRCFESCVTLSAYCSVPAWRRYELWSCVSPYLVAVLFVFIIWSELRVWILNR